MGVNWFGNAPKTKATEEPPAEVVQPKKPAGRSKRKITKTPPTNKPEKPGVPTKRSIHWGYKAAYLALMVATIAALHGVGYLMTGQAPDPWKSVAIGSVLWHGIVAVMMR